MARTSLVQTAIALETGLTAALKRRPGGVTSLHINDGLPPSDARWLGRDARQGRADVAVCLRIPRDARFEGPLIMESYVWRETKADPIQELRQAKAFIERENRQTR